MGFQLFKEYGAASREEATIRSRGTIFLSDAILNRISMKNAEAFQLLFDEERCALAIELLETYERKNRAQRKISQERSGVAINAAPMLRYFNFRLGKKRSVEVEIDGKLVVLDLSELDRRKPANSGSGVEDSDTSQTD